MATRCPARLMAGSLLALACLVPASPSLADHSWGNYHWARTSNPFTLKVGDNVTSNWDSILLTTAFDWTASSVLDISLVVGGTDPRRCKPGKGRVEVCNAKYGFNGWLGIAQIWASGNHITQGITKLNDSYFNTATYNTVAWRNLVMCQEVGHTLGLDHQDEAFDNANLGTCMDYTSNPATNQHPNAHDYEQLESIYAHTDSVSTLTSAVSGTSPLRPSANDVDLDSRREWGRLIRARDGGRTETYERDLGGGQTLITHVIWAF